MAQRARLYAESDGQSGVRGREERYGGRASSVGNGGNGFSILLGKLHGVGNWRKNSQQIPAKSGNEKPDFVGEMEGGWEFPAFSRGREGLNLRLRIAD